MNANVLEAIKNSAAVPSMPQLVSRFLEIMRDPDFDYRDLAKVLSADPGTVSEILRLANSALFGVRRKIVTLRHALRMLGPKRTRSLLLGRYLVDAMASKQVPGLDMNYFWRRSLASSVVALRLADSVLPRLRDEAFIAALLADIGIPILAEALPDCYGSLAADFKPYGKPLTAQREHETVQASHAEVSAMVLAHWTLPDLVANAVNLHQSPSPGEGDIGTLARVLNASDGIAQLLCEVPQTDEVVTVCSQATALIGAEMEILVNLLPSIENDIRELATTLRISVIPSDAYALIAETIQEDLSPSPAS